MVKGTNILASYRNGNYTVVIFNDGTKIRHTEDDQFIADKPESIDLTITKRCNQGCSYCYANCHPMGSHADLTHEVLDSLTPGMEIALNGNDMNHPQLEEFLERAAARKLIINLTVNQHQFMGNLDTIQWYNKIGWIKGIGVSLLDSYDEIFLTTIKSFPNVVLHIINGILTLSDVENLILYPNLKILILGYKKVGRGISYNHKMINSIAKNQEMLKNELDRLRLSVKVIAFDNLALEQLDVKSLLSKEDWERFYMGDDGIGDEYTSASFYIDLVDETFSVNSCSKEVFPIAGTVGDMFSFLKERYNGKKREKRNLNETSKDKKTPIGASGGRKDCLRKTI